MVFKVLVLLSYVIVPVAQAGIFSDVEVKGTYEDNVVGLLLNDRGGTSDTSSGASSGMMNAMDMGGGSSSMPSSQYTGSGSQSNGDTSITLFADLGSSAVIAGNTSLFLVGSAQHTAYSTYTQFDSTIGGLSTGISNNLADVLTAKFAVNGYVKKYGDSSRDSSAYGATLSCKERITQTFWLKETYDYEQNNADSALFTYQGSSVSAWAGYLVLPHTTFLLGYNYLVRDFYQQSGFKLRANTASVGVEHELDKKWFLDSLYDHQSSGTSAAGTNTANNSISIGLRYSY